MLEIMQPDEQVFRNHIDSGPFQNGVDRGWWRLISISWPIALIGVAAFPRPNGSEEYFFRFDLTNYPQSAPTSVPWDMDLNIVLEKAKWPGGRDRLREIFRFDFLTNEQHHLYLPCDRLAISHHPEWVNVHPHLFWKPSSDLTLYLGFIHGLLNSIDYTGPCGA